MFLQIVKMSLESFVTRKLWVKKDNSHLTKTLKCALSPNLTVMKHQMASFQTRALARLALLRLQ